MRPTVVVASAQFAPLAALASALLLWPIASASAACPNEALRAVNNSAQLPDCRAYEMISPADKSQTAAGGFSAVSDSGDLAPITMQAVDDRPSQPSAGTTNIAERTVTGWILHPLGGPPAYLWQPGGGLITAFDFSQDFRGALTWASTSTQAGRMQTAFYRPGIDGSWTALSPVFSPLTGSISSSSEYSYLGGSADLSRVWFAPSPTEDPSSVSLLPGDPAPAGVGSMANLYEADGSGTGTPALQLVQRDLAANVVGGRCGAALGSVKSSGRAHRRNAVSADGTVVYWTTRPSQTGTGVCSSANRLRVMKTVEGQNPLQVSASQCTRTAADPGGACSTIAGDDRFEAGSADGQRVFFSSPRQLVGNATMQGDTDSTNDLYLYDSSPPPGQPNLVQVSAGEATDTHPTVGSGANVLGLVRASEDGSRAYFVASGKLTATPNSLGQIPIDGQPNLYVYERDAGHPSGRLAFIASLAPTDASIDFGFGALWSLRDTNAAQVVPMRAGPSTPGDGHMLVFLTAASIVTSGPQADSDGVEDIYRYDDETGAIQRISAGEAGAGTGPFEVAVPSDPLPVSSASAANHLRWASEDANTIAFGTREALVPSDTNDRGDLYLWRDGHLARLFDSLKGDNPNSGYGSEFFGLGTPSDVLMSPSGDDVLFRTERQLVPADSDFSADLYDARVGGGFPAPAQAGNQTCDLSNDACQPAGAADVPIAPATSSGRSGGNATPGPRAMFSLRRLSPTQRRGLAAGTPTSFTITVNRPGRVTLRGQAKLKGHTRRMFTGSAMAADGGAHVTVRLSGAARSELRRKGRLRLVVTVSFSPAREPLVTAINLTRPRPVRPASRPAARRPTR